METELQNMLREAKERNPKALLMISIEGSGGTNIAHTTMNLREICYLTQVLQNWQQGLISSMKGQSNEGG